MAPRRKKEEFATKKRRRRDDDGEERRVSTYLDIYADEADDEEEEEEHEEDDDGFFVDDPGEGVPDDVEPGERVRNSHLVARRNEDDDELDVAALEKMVNERYGPTRPELRSPLVARRDQVHDEVTEVERRSRLPSINGSKLWLVKCSPGQERKVAASLMQKSLDKGSESRILSAIALDHLKNYIYVEADNEAFVREACKLMHNISSQSIKMVPVKEMSSVISVGNKRSGMVSKGDWVRLKRSKNGSLAKVVHVDDVRQKVTVRVPLLSALSLSGRREGVYKKVAFSSVVTKGISPSISEVEHFQEIGEDVADLAALFTGKDQWCLLRGDAVVVVKGELKNLKGSVEYVDEETAHIRFDEKISKATIAMHKNHLAKYFEPGCHVKVVHGAEKGTTGMVIKVDQNKLVILADASKKPITVLAGQVVESEVVVESNSAVGDCRETMQNFSKPHPASSGRLLLGRNPSSTVGRGGAGHFAKRHNSVIGKHVKILQGPYRGYRGCVKGINGHNIRVELEAQMKEVLVDRSHISDKFDVPHSNMPQDRTREETPLPPRTPMHSMGGETPWRTPFRTPGPPTPIHCGSAAPTCGLSDPSLLRSPTLLIPTP